jgi:hypothetical protein
LMNTASGVTRYIFIANTLLYKSVGLNISYSSFAIHTRLQVNDKIIDDFGRIYERDSIMVVNQAPTGYNLNDPKPVLYLGRQGSSGEAYGAMATFKLSRYEVSSTHSRTRLDIDLTHDSFNDVNVFRLLSSGAIVLPLLPTTNPGAGSKQLWADPADGYRVKFAV